MPSRSKSAFLNGVMESSFFAGTIPRIAADSVVVAIVGTIGRGLRRVGRRIACAAGADPASDAAHLAMIGGQSRLIQVLERMVGTVDISWEQSRFRMLSRSAREVTVRLSLSRRIFLLGWMVAVAAAVHRAMALAMGTPMTPITLSISSALLSGGLMTMAFHGHLAAAWSERMRRRGHQ